VANLNATYQPNSLTQHFAASDGFAGCFGWLCGYSADATFLDVAAERFMGLTSPRRAHGGRIGLAVMLDPGNSQITMLAAPGVLHLPMKPMRVMPFKLLHAKVALLGFNDVDAGERWKLRLIVSTGNWTRATQDQNIDIAWTLELKSEDLSSDAVDLRLARADIHAAWSLLTWLRGHFDDRALTANAKSETGAALKRFESWCKAVKQPQSVASRFMDTRKASLLSQLPERIPKRGGNGAVGHVARNYLSMGSGFYESSGVAEQVPPVLEKIVKVLRDHGLLTARADISLVVNPNDCQAVATCIDAVVAQKWSVRRPELPKFLGTAARFMHAKFIFSANNREGTNKCTSPWVYLGSGNLTKPGFDSRMCASGGNLEAGVLLVLDLMLWDGGKGVDPTHVVGNLLPIVRERASDHPIGNLSAGAGMVERETAFLAAPVGWLDWEEGSDAAYLVGAVSEGPELEVLDARGLPCTQVSPGQFAWLSGRPRQAEVRWDDAYVTTVPVLDKYGRFGGTVLPAIELDAVWWQLDSFPLPPEDEDADIDGDLPTRAGNGTAGARTSETRYPVRDMMQMIENIAARQTALRESDWNAWCIRLQQSLEQAAGSAGVAYFIMLGLNPLSPLHATPFRPTFAEDASTTCGLRYEQALRSVERTWGVGELSAIGAIT